MDTKTVYGFILIASGFAFMVMSKYLGVDGVIEAGCNTIISAGLLLIVGKELYNRSKV